MRLFEPKEFRPGVEVINMKEASRPKGICQSRAFPYDLHYIGSTLHTIFYWAVMVLYDDGEYEQAVDIEKLSIIDRRK